MLALFGSNAWLWTVKGAAVHYGWMVNSDYFIIRNLAGFSFMTAPLFTALIMADAVSKDFRLGVDPLIFSKPVRPLTYLAAKFSGNFFVLVVCQSSFIVTMIVLQFFPTGKMSVGPHRVFPFFKHFFFFTVVSHLLLAAMSFSVGTATRNPKIVYGLMVTLYPFYIAYQLLLLKPLSPNLRALFDPMLMGWVRPQVETPGGEFISAKLISELVVRYDSVAVANRSVVIIISILLLGILYLRFSIVQREKSRDRFALTTINLAPQQEWLVPAHDEPSLTVEAPASPLVEIPKVRVRTAGIAAGLKQWKAALAVELRLIKEERGLIILLPIGLLLCVVTLIAFPPAAGSLQTAFYAFRISEMITLFLVAIAVLFIGESMHRDRELRIEPLLWSAPVPNAVLLLSKFVATFLIAIGFSVLVGISGIILQLRRGDSSFDVTAYPKTYLLILVPSVIFLVSTAMMLNVILREKYVAYAISFALAIGGFYLFGQGHKHWSYNIVLYEIWSPTDLFGSSLWRLLGLRVYALAVAAVCLLIAHLCFARRTG
jgi:ABC-type transport system involved in multi-copper enzyme maturation permease subunit